MYTGTEYSAENRRNKSEGKLITSIHEKKIIYLGGRAIAEQQLPSSYLWVAVFLLVSSPSSSVLLLPLSS